MFTNIKHDLKFLTLTYSCETHTKTPIEHFFEDYKIIRKRVLQPQSVTQYAIWCELTETGTLHWHIIVEPKDTIKFKIACGWWTKNRGFINVKAVTNLMGLTTEYLEKERVEMEAYLFRGNDKPSFPLREYLDPSVILNQEELFINEQKLASRKKAIIQDLKNFQYYGKQVQRINHLTPSSE